MRLRLRHFVLVQSVNCGSTISDRRYDGRRDFGQRGVGRPDRGAARPARRCRPCACSPTVSASAPATVAKAYQALRQRGVVETAGRNGTRVRPRPAGRHRPLAACASRRRPARVDLATGEPDPRLLPGARPAAAPRSPRRRPCRSAYATPACCPSWPSSPRRRLAADGVPTPSRAHRHRRRAGRHRAPARRPPAPRRPGRRRGPGLGQPPRPGRRARPASRCRSPVDDEGPDRRPAPRAALAAGVRALVVTSPRAEPDRRGGQRRAAPRPCAPSSPAHPEVLVIEDDHAAELAGGAAARRWPARPRSWAFLRSVSKPYGPDLRVAVARRRRGDRRPGRRPDAARRRLGLHAAAAPGRRAVAGPGGRGGGRSRRRDSYERRRDRPARRRCRRARRRVHRPDRHQRLGAGRATRPARSPRCATRGTRSRPARSSASTRRRVSGSPSARST